jgi:hypothetical protein
VLLEQINLRRQQGSAQSGYGFTVSRLAELVANFGRLKHRLLSGVR